jgi:hypothetical protein
MTSRRISNESVVHDRHEVWERKSQLNTTDLKELNGYVSTTINPEEVANKVSAILNIHIEDKVLEVDYGAGMIAQYLDCD